MASRNTGSDEIIEIDEKGIVHGDASGLRPLGDGIRERLGKAAEEDQKDAQEAKPSARSGRKFLSLSSPAQGALADLGRQFGCDADTMAAFLRAALTPETIKRLVTEHLTMSSGKGGGA